MFNIQFGRTVIIRKSRVSSLTSCIAILFSFFLFSGTSEVFAANATLTWNANSEVDLAGYKVYFGTSSGAYGPAINIGKQTNYTVTNLGIGTYYFAVTAYDTSGNESPFSLERSKTFSGSTPPVISGVLATGITSSGVTILWNTNQAATSQVAYGLTTGYGSFSALNSTRVSSHSRNLTGLSPATTYNYRVISTDAAGNTATSGNFTFTTAPVADTTAPVLSSIAVSGLNSTQATVSWTSNEAATSQVAYGLTTSYSNISALNSTRVTSHSRNLTGLSPATTYNYRVISTDAAGNTATSGNFIFTTAPANTDTSTPLLSNIDVRVLNAVEATVTWNTNEGATAQVEYGTSPSYGQVSPQNILLRTSHSRSLIGLAPATIYHYRVISTDAAGNTATSGNFTFTTAVEGDVRGPQISSVTVSNITPTSATILWGTDEAASGQIAYGTTPSYGSLSILNQSLSFSHSQKLEFLQGNTTYHFQVLSADAFGNKSTSSAHSFTTPFQTDTTPPADVLNFKAQPGLRTVTLNWTNPSDPDFMGVRIIFRTDRFPNSLQDGTHLGDFTGERNASLEASHIDLENALTYYYIAASYDNAGNFQSTVRASATTLQPNNEKGDAASSGSGCGMILPTDGDPPGPGQSADMVGLFGLLLIFLIKNKIRDWRFTHSTQIVQH